MNNNIYPQLCEYILCAIISPTTNTSHGFVFTDSGISATEIFGIRPPHPWEAIRIHSHAKPLEQLDWNWRGRNSPEKAEYVHATVAARQPDVYNYNQGLLTPPPALPIFRSVNFQEVA